MKLTTFILITTFLQVSATGFAQKVSLAKKNAPIEKVFEEISSQTGYDFLFTTATLKNVKPVTVKVKEGELNDVLKMIFAGQPLEYSIENKAILVRKKIVEPIKSGIATIQLTKYTGTVKDASGIPLAGVNVMLSGTKNAVVTDKKGSFTIEANQGDILVFTYVGYKTKEFTLTAKTAINLVMDEAVLELKAVSISTGIFEKPVASFTGAASTITSEQILQSGSGDILSALRNVDPAFNLVVNNAVGSNPNVLSQITIRGASSLPTAGQYSSQQVSNPTPAQLQDQKTAAALNTPLFILDGFEVPQERIMDMNVNIVANITILKDASATAIYGSRGSNGVVVVTTKPPLAGKLRVSYRADLYAEIPDLTSYDVLNSSQLLSLQQKVGLFKGSVPANDVRLTQYYNNVLNSVNNGVNTYWLSKPLQVGIDQRHNLVIEGGDKIRYALSTSYIEKSGVMKGSKRNTFNENINLSYLTRNVKFTNSLFLGIVDNAESQYGSFSDYARASPYYVPTNNIGQVTQQLGEEYGSYEGFYGFWGQKSFLPSNPLFNASTNSFDKAKSLNLTNNTAIDYSITKALKLRGQLSVSKTTSHSDVFRSANNTAFLTYSAADQALKGDYTYGVGDAMGYSGQLNLTYSKTIAEKHLLFAGLNYDISQNANTNYSFLAVGYNGNPLDGFLGGALQYPANKTAPQAAEGLIRTIGITGNASYVYDQKYFVDFAFRKDGASQFGSQKRWAPFWSAGAGWNLERESFFKNVKFIDRLKLRGSVGVTGSQNFSPYQAQTVYNYMVGTSYNNSVGVTLAGYGNPDLRWQQQKKYNLGLDASLLKGNLILRGDFYRTRTTNMVSSAYLQPSNGFDSYVNNVGSMQNVGYEIAATAFVLRNVNHFSWSLTTSFIHNNNKILKLSPALVAAQNAALSQALASTLGPVTEPRNTYKEGYSINTIWAVPSLGIDPSNGKEMYLDKDGIPTYTWNAANLRAVGNTNPDINGIFSTMFRYKSFTANFIFGYQFGGQLYNTTLINKVENANYRYNVDSRVYSDRWQKPGDIVAYKGLNNTTTTLVSSRFVQDENTLTCNNIFLNYDFALGALTNKLKIQRISAGINMSNPFYLSTVKQERGTSYPFSRNVSMNLQVIF
jgi:TonB-linked SusC/RagA family outer membrane protein